MNIDPKKIMGQKPNVKFFTVALYWQAILKNPSDSVAQREWVILSILVSKGQSIQIPKGRQCDTNLRTGYDRIR